MRQDITFFGRRVENQPWLGLAVAFVVAYAVVWLTLGAAVFVVGMALSVPLHFLLRCAGRRGFYHRESSRVGWLVDREGFRASSASSPERKATP